MLTEKQRMNLLIEADDMEALGHMDDAKALRELLASAAPAEGRKQAADTIRQWIRDHENELNYCEFDRIDAALDRFIDRLATAPTIPEDCDVRKILLRVVPGDGDGLEIYAKNVSEVESLLSELGERLEDFESRKTAPTMSEAVRPVVVLAYSTKGHSKPCGQTMGANGCGEFVTIYYGDIDVAEATARAKIAAMQRESYRFNWALVMRADEEAYHGPAMTVERIDRANAEGEKS